MLSETSLYIANKVAKQLEQSKIKVVPLSGSPISMLSTGTADVIAHPTEPSSYIPAIQHDSMNASGNVTGESLHDEKMEWAVTLIHRGVSRDLDIAKNVVQPVIDLTLDNLEKDLCEALSAKVHGYEIVENQVPELYRDQRILNLFERYEKIRPEPMSALLAFPELNLAEIMERVKTGDEDLDGLLNSVIGAELAEEIVNLYTYYFCEKGTRVINFDEFSKGKASIPVILYFLTLGLEAKLPDGVNASLVNVTNYLRNLRGSLGAVVYRAIKQIDARVERKELISHVDVVGPERKIYVNGVVYNQFLNEGGSPEAIFGAVCGKTPYDYNVILGSREKLCRTWSANLDSIRASNEMNKLSLTITSIRKTLSTVVDEMEVIPEGAGSKADIHGRIRAATSNIYTTDLINLPHTVKRVVFTAIFPEQKNARFILNSIDQQECEEGDVKRLATSVTVSLIAEWLVKNLEVVKADEQN